MANWIGSARTNYVRLAEGFSQEDLEVVLSALGQCAEIVENEDGRVAILPSENSDDGSFNGWVNPDLPEEMSAMQEDFIKKVLGISSLEEAESMGDVEFSWSMIMPMIAPGEVLVVQTIGAEKLRYLTGYSMAYVRNEAGDVKEVHVSVDDIYEKAEKEFSGLPGLSVTEATY